MNERVYSSTEQEATDLIDGADNKVPKLREQFDPDEPNHLEKRSNGVHEEEIKDEEGWVRVLVLDRIREINLDSIDGHYLLHDLIKTYGWTALFRGALEDEHKGIDILEYCVLNFSDYQLLPDNELEGLFDFEQNAFTFSILNSIKNNRETLSTAITEYDPNHLSLMLDEQGIEFRNVEILDQKVAEIIQVFPDLLDQAVKKQQQWYVEVYDMPPPFIETLRQVDNLFIAYKMDILHEYARRLRQIGDFDSDAEWEISEERLEIYEGIFPDIEDLQQLFHSQITQHAGLYKEFLQIQEHFDSEVQIRFGRLRPDIAQNIFPVLYDAAKDKFPDSVERQLAYTLNASATPLAENTFLVRGPDGQMIDVLEVVLNDDPELDDEFYQPMNSDIPINQIIHLLAMMFKGNFADKKSVSSALYINFHEFPEDIQEHLSSIGFEPYSGERFIPDSRIAYDLAEGAGVDDFVSPEIANEVIDRLMQNVSKSLSFADYESCTTHLEEIIDHFEDTYDGDVVNAEAVSIIVRQLSPAVVKEIEASIKVKLGQLQDFREFIALCNFLYQHEAVEPFKKLNELMEGAMGEDERLNRLKTFLIHSYDSDVLENATTIVKNLDSAQAEQLFGSYAKSIKHATSLKFHLDEEMADRETLNLVEQFELGLIRRGGHLFSAGKDMISGTYKGAENIEDLLVGFRGMEQLQMMIAGMGNPEHIEISDVSFAVGDKSMKTIKFICEDTTEHVSYVFKVSIRPEATVEGEARINFELSLDDLPEDNRLRQVFEQKIEYAGQNGRRPKTFVGSTIRFGFDLDTRSNPPKFSFDMGRNAYSGSNMKRTGDVLGRILSQVTSEGHHLQDFHPALSDPDNFKSIAEAFISHFESIAVKHIRSSVAAAA